VWAKRDGLLVNVALNELAEMHGFVINKEKSLLRCNRFAKPKPDGELLKGSLAAGCEFHVKVRAMSNTSKLNKTATKWTYTPIWDGPVKIVSKCCEHTGTCTPSAENRIVVLKRLGKAPPIMSLKELLDTLKAVMDAYPTMTDEQKVADRRLQLRWKRSYRLQRINRHKNYFSNEE